MFFVEVARMERNHDRAKDKTTMTISLEASLLEKIDALAKKDGRPRSNWVVHELRKRVAILETFTGAGEKSGADAGGPFTPSTRIPASALPEVHGDPRVNEDPRETKPAVPHPRSTKPGVAKTVASRKGQP